MSQSCPYCGNETAGADPCPWCSGSMGVAPEHPHITPVIIHDVEPKRSNGWAIAAVLLAIVAIFIVVFERKSSDELAVNQNKATEHDFVINSQAPLFPITNLNPPKIAKTASLQRASAPPEPKASKASTSGDEETDDTTSDTTPAAQTDVVTTRPTSNAASVQLVDVQLATQSDGDGHEMAVGTATIYNNSPYQISNYNFLMSTGIGSYRLMPYTGSQDNPQPLTARSIPAGGRLTVPLISDGTYSVADDGATKTVTVEVTENGETASSHVTVE